MGQKIFNILIFFAICGLYTLRFIDSKEDIPISSPVKVEEKVAINTPEFLKLEVNDTLLVEALHYYNVKYPEIVFAQAVLETGYFKSKVCKDYNNLFGLYNSHTNEYFKFDHWSESVLAYMEYVQRKYNPSECYYTFLEELPYAMDPNYINKIKQIVKRLEDISIRRYSWT